MARLIRLVLLAQLLQVAGGQTIEQVYARGTQAYEKGQWALAIQEFESILQRGYESVHLYYNLGNAYYRYQVVGGAVWAYAKALELSPGDEDARYNLTLAQLRVKDRIDLPEVPTIVKSYRALRGRFSPAQWLFWLSAMGVVVAGAYALGRARRLLWPGQLAGWGLVLMLAVATLMVDSAMMARSVDEGVITSPTVSAFSAPSEKSVRLFDIHEGHQVMIRTTSPGWVEVELLDGKTGWITQNTLRPL